MAKLTNFLRGQSASRPSELISLAEERLEAGRAAMIAAEAALDAARAAYDASLGSGRDAALAARRARDEAEVDVDVSRAALTVLVVELDAARDRAKADETARLVERATEKARQFEVLVRRELPVLAASARNLARLWAEAEIAREDANRMIESRADHLPSLEKFRVPDHRKTELIEETIVDLWVVPGTFRPLNDNELERVREENGKYFLYWKGKGGVLDNPEELGPKVRFKRTTTLPGERPHEIKPLLTSLNIPGLTAIDHDGWSALQHLTPHDVLDRLSKFEKILSVENVDRRIPEVKIKRYTDEQPI